MASSVSTWITQRHEDRRDLLAKRLFYREQLYSDFISESAHAMADAIQHGLQDPNKLTPTYALLSRIRLNSSTNVLASAERVIQHIINTYSEPNLTPQEIQSRPAEPEDPEFSNICRAELEAMQNPLRYSDCGAVSRPRSSNSRAQVTSVVRSRHFQQIRHPHDA